MTEPIEPEGNAREHEGRADGDRDSAPILLARASHRSRRGHATSSTPGEPARPRRRSGTLTRLLGSRLGTAGLVVAAGLVLVAASADLLASDLPIACSLHGHTYVLPAITRPSVLVGMPRDRLGADVGWKLDPLVRHGPATVDRSTAIPLLAPLAQPGHPLGTDRAGRDVFARIVHGTRTYLVFAFAAVGASLVLGALLGSIAGLAGGAPDALIGRVIETVSAFPPLVLILGIQAALSHPTLFTLLLAIALTRWPEVARLVRGEVMFLAARDFVLAARALGASPARVLRKHIAPAVRGSLIVSAALGISAVVLTEASLDFLHVGAEAAGASWGETMSEFRDAPHAWWLLTFPGLMLFATVVGHNLLGEAIRRALDPRPS